MIANYHTHTPRCHHAFGAEDAYVRSAIDAGLQILGFSDHTPYPFPDGFVSSFRMLPSQLSDYTDTVLALRKKYADQLTIHLGVEAEYYPRFFPQLVQLLSDHGVEYMILGQHMLFNEVEGISSIGPSAGTELLRRYCDQCIDALYTGLFTYFAHPDLHWYQGEPGPYRQEVRRLCKAARECGVPLEINLLGIRERRHYPNPLFWEVAAEENCPVILGCDAHRPSHLHEPEILQAGRAIVERYDLALLDTVALRPVK